MSDAPKPSAGQSFLRVVQWTGTLGLGAMVGFMFSVKQIRPTMEMDWGISSPIAFIAGAIFFWKYWNVVFGTPAPGSDPVKVQQSRKRWTIALVVILSLTILAAFALSLRNTESKVLLDVIKGSVAALFAVSIALYLFWRSVQFLEQDTRDAENAEKNPPSPPPQV